MHSLETILCLQKVPGDMDEGTVEIAEVNGNYILAFTYENDTSLEYGTQTETRQEVQEYLSDGYTVVYEHPHAEILMVPVEDEEE